LCAISSSVVSSPGDDRAVQHAETAVVEPMGRGIPDSPRAQGLTGQGAVTTAPLPQIAAAGRPPLRAMVIDVPKSCGKQNLTNRKSACKSGTF